MDKLWVGIDVANDDFTCGVGLKGRAHYLDKFDNVEAGFKLLQTAIMEYQSPGQQVMLVLEATGGYELRLLTFAYQQGWSICLPNAKQVRDNAKGDGQRNKTDSQDALMLTRYGMEKRPQPQQLLAAEIVAMDDLLQRRLQLEKQLRAENNRLKQTQQRPIPTPGVIASLKRTIAHVEEELKEIEQQLQALLTAHPQHQRMAKRLQTAPGVGKKNVLPLLVQQHRFQARTNGQGTAKGIVAYTGLDPTLFSSGRTVYRRPLISKMGDSALRRYLYMGALGGVRGNNPLKHFYRGLVDRGKSGKLALIASARKILVWTFMMFTTETDFDPSRHPMPDLAS